MDSSTIWLLFVAQRIAGGGILQAHNGRDITRIELVDLFPVVGMHLQDTADALALALWWSYRHSCRDFSVPE